MPPVQFLPKELWGGLSSLQPGFQGLFGGLGRGLGMRGTPAVQMQQQQAAAGERAGERDIAKLGKERALGFPDFGLLYEAQLEKEAPETNFWRTILPEIILRLSTAFGGKPEAFKFLEEYQARPRTQGSPSKPPAGAGYQEGGKVTKKRGVDDVLSLIGMEKGEVPIVAHEGEVVLRREAVDALGGSERVDVLNQMFAQAPKAQAGGIARPPSGGERKWQEYKALYQLRWPGTPEDQVKKEFQQGLPVPSPPEEQLGAIEAGGKAEAPSTEAMKSLTAALGGGGAAPEQRAAVLATHPANLIAMALTGRPMMGTVDAKEPPAAPAVPEETKPVTPPITGPPPVGEAPTGPRAGDYKSPRPTGPPAMDSQSIMQMLFQAAMAQAPMMPPVDPRQAPGQMPPGLQLFDQLQGQYGASQEAAIRQSAVAQAKAQDEEFWAVVTADPGKMKDAEYQNLLARTAQAWSAARVQEASLSDAAPEQAEKTRITTAKSWQDHAKLILDVLKEFGDRPQIWHAYELSMLRYTLFTDPALLTADDDTLMNMIPGRRGKSSLTTEDIQAAREAIGRVIGGASGGMAPADIQELLRSWGIEAGVGR